MNFSKAVLLLAFVAVFGAANGSRTLKGSSKGATDPLPSFENITETMPPLPSEEEECAAAMAKEDCVMACFGMT